MIPFLKQINAGEIEKNKISEGGVFINFSFADKSEEGSSDEVRDKLQPGTLEFLRTIKSFIQTIDTDVFIGPTDERRNRFYQAYLQRIPKPRIYMFDLLGFTRLIAA